MHVWSLTLLFILGMAAYMLSYKRAASYMHSTHEPWHGLPVHFAWIAALNTLALAFAIWVLWWVAREPLIEAYLMQQLPMPDDQDMTFFMMSVRRMAGNGASQAMSQDVGIWAEHYRELMRLGNYVVGAAMALCAMMGLIASYRHIKPDVMVRVTLERRAMAGLRLCAWVSVAITFLIFSSVVLEAWRFFGKIPMDEFLFGLKWSPQTALRADQAGASGVFGAVPLFLGTLLITLIALLVSVPIGIFCAIYLHSYASPRVRKLAKPALEILAGIPTVVYGFFALTTMAPFLQLLGGAMGLDVASESALAAGMVMGIVLIPLVSSMSDDALAAVPKALSDASFGLGATTSETVKRVLLPAALPGIMGGVLLATSRAIGETMIVVMAAGLSAHLTVNPLESVTTITVQIVALLVGDQEFDSAKTLAAFALGLTLFIFTLLLNIVALVMVRRYRQRYD